MGRWYRYDFADHFKQPPTLETDRLRLRPVREDDAEAVFAAVSDPAVTQYLSWHEHFRLSESIAFVRWVIGESAEGRPAQWAMETRADGRFIGLCGIVAVEPKHHRAEIGYWLGRRDWGQGYMTEALRETIRHGFDDLGMFRIEGFCLPENLASARVMERAGMTHEGTLRHYVWAKKQHHDVRVFSILRREFAAPTP